ncbi:spore coat associated protein CotJA [Paenibacillus pinistramenti]|uniref:spore coat associated protein CotJA n=1 Tax=Paenibacillus pinistramenti TaxID=1768003 RepID=UPI001109EA6D|nr:spore coat associated protein CotJA [Paenibacillus pinistramenti]
MEFSQVRVYHPFVGPFDPCPPILTKTYQTPVQLFIPFQPPNLPQFNPQEALFKGTLWPALYSPYESKWGKEQ